MSIQVAPADLIRALSYSKIPLDGLARDVRKKHVNKGAGFKYNTLSSTFHQAAIGLDLTMLNNGGGGDAVINVDGIDYTIHNNVGETLNAAPFTQLDVISEGPTLNKIDLTINAISYDVLKSFIKRKVDFELWA